MNKKMVFKAITTVGVKLFELGLNNSHSGNISVRQKNKIYISRTGCMLDQMRKKDIVSVNIDPDPVLDQKASMELLVHRAIYQTNPSVKSVVHAHPPYSIVLAHNTKDNIVPYDHEGSYFLKGIPVLRPKNAIASSEVAREIVRHVHDYKSIVIAAHGVFAWGTCIEEAYHYITVTESACRINYLIGLKYAAAHNRN